MVVTIFFLLCIIFFYIYGWVCYFLSPLLDKFLDFNDYICSTNKVVYKIIRILPAIIYLIGIAIILIFFPDGACLLISVVTLVVVSDLLILYFVGRKKY